IDAYVDLQPPCANPDQRTCPPIPSPILLPPLPGGTQLSVWADVIARTRGCLNGARAGAVALANPKQNLILPATSPPPDNDEGDYADHGDFTYADDDKYAPDEEEEPVDPEFIMDMSEFATSYELPQEGELDILDGELTLEELERLIGPLTNIKG